MIAGNYNENSHTFQLGPFLQDIATTYTVVDGLPSSKVCTIVSTSNGAVYAGTDAGLALYNPDQDHWAIVDLASSPERPQSLLRRQPAIRHLCIDRRAHREDSLIVLTEDRLIQLNATGQITHQMRHPLYRNVCAVMCSAVRLYLLTGHMLLDYDGSLLAMLPEGLIGSALLDVSSSENDSYSESVFIGSTVGLFHYADGKIERVTLKRTNIDVIPNAEEQAVSETTEFEIVALTSAKNGGDLWIATRDTLYLCTGAAPLNITALNITAVCPPPTPAARVLFLTESAALWIGAPEGAACLLDGRWRYFAGRRWLPGNSVRDLVITSDGTAWIATDSGVARIATCRITYVEKAAHYEQITFERHNRDGFIADCFLPRAGDTTGVLQQATDNDGLWTALYVCAESFRYAVTGEEEARSLARAGLYALLDLVKVTGIPGFPARALIRRSETVHQSDPGPNWYASPTFDATIYKNDTSSDEIDGHYLAWYVFSELAADENDRAAIAEVCRMVTDHILDNHYTLVGPTGKPTRWGVWSPDALNADPAWAAERGLNSLEILSHLKVAQYLCAGSGYESRYEEAYHHLIRDHHYALNAITQKIRPPVGENNHSDDQLAACAYYPLLHLEIDPHLRAQYLLSLKRTWEILRPEGSPLHNVIFGACSGQLCDAEAVAEWLRSAPWDLREWEMRNSHRADVTVREDRDRFQNLQLRRPVAAGEGNVLKWNRNPYQADWEGDGTVEMDGTFWLLPYWMARYHAI